MRRKKMTVTLIVLVVLSAGIFGALCYMMGGPRGAYGFVRYGLPQMRRGDLHVGDAAPDFEAIAPDGVTNVRLHERLGAKPLVLIFGSYT